jgi:hypothetical protein
MNFKKQDGGGGANPIPVIFLQFVKAACGNDLTHNSAGSLIPVEETNPS